MRKTKMGIMITLILMLVGFAAITTTLVINGTITLGVNSFSEDILFTSASTESGSKAIISSDGKSITFNTKELRDIGDISTLNFDVMNKSRQYDAAGTIECTINEKSTMYDEYVSITPNPSTFTIEATEKLSGSVKVQMIKSFTGTETGDKAEIEFKCTLSATSEGREEEAPEKTEIKNNVTVISGTGENVGDEVTIGTEHFYVISNDGTNVKMLAKYNLNVGYTYGKNIETNKWELTPIENPTGMQDSEMLGYKEGIFPLKGLTSFGSSGVVYGKNEDINLNYANSIVGEHISNYISKLNSLYDISATGTIITKGEIETIVGQTLEDGDNISEINSNTPEWLYNTSYWTRSAYEYDSIYKLYSDGVFSYQYTFISKFYSGVRPVITISASLLK